MTDAALEGEPNTGVTEDPPPPTDGDAALRALVNLVNEHGLEMGITFHMGGSLVTGTLVSMKTYWKGVGTDVRGSNGAETVHDALARLFESWGGPSDDELATNVEPATDAELHRMVRSVHLRKASVVSPSGHFGPELPWWRGRIDAVAGWTVGSLERAG